MSELQRSFAKTKLSSLPFNPPIPLESLSDEAGYFDEEEEDEDALRPLPSPSSTGAEDDSSSASSASSTGTIVPSPGRRLFARGKGPSSSSRLAPLPWTDFFSQSLDVTPSHPAHITHHAYITPPTSPSGPLFVMHHGAGSSALSFAALALEIRKAAPEAGILAIDARGHGQTTIGDPSAASSTHGFVDLSLEALCGDLERAYDAVRQWMSWPEDMGVLLVGHSLGGAVVATVAKEGRLKAKILGFAVIDVVEGSAIDALQSMHAYLSSRPSSFAGVEQGIEWHVRSRTLRNSASARASVPALLKPEGPPLFSSSSAPSSAPAQDSAIPTAASSSPTRYTWKTDLAATQPFWESWFTGLSSKFLSARGGKLLLLAGTDRLDKELMIGQMQGRFALQIFPETGHFVHEDAPAKTAGMLVDFWRRNDGRSLVLPPKVGDLLKRGERV